MPCGPGRAKAGPALEERRQAPTGDDTACHACVQPRHAAIAAVKTIHTLAWLSIESCVIYTLYAGFAGRTGKRAAAAAAVVVGEVLLFAGNGFRCPLTGLARRLGTQSGSVTRHLPAEMARAQPAGNPRTASRPDGVPARTEPAAVALSSAPDWLICMIGSRRRAGRTALRTTIGAGVMAMAGCRQCCWRPRRRRISIPRRLTRPTGGSSAARCRRDPCGGVTGVLAEVDGGRITVRAAQPGPGRPVPGNSYIRIGSSTKTLVATVLL